MVYQHIGTDVRAILDNGEEIAPVGTLADEYGGRMQIAIDDHCYVLYLVQSDGSYKRTAWISREAFEVLQTLPSPS